MAKVWIAYAGSDNTTEENLIGVYTSRTKARRAVLDAFDLKRGKWDEPDRNFLDISWLNELEDMPMGSYGWVSQRKVL